MIPSGAIRPETTLVFLGVCAEYDENGRATVKAVGERIDRSLATVHKHLVKLRDAGLVDWDDDHKGTLRPTVQRVAA